MDIKENLRNLALQLRFEFKPGIQAFLESPTALKLLGQKNVPDNPTILKNPIVQGMIEKVFIGTATGFYNNYEFYIMRGIKGSTTSNKQNLYYAVMALLFKNHQELGLNITKKKSAITRFFSSKYAKINNNPELDSMISVRADKKEQVQAFINEGTVQKALIDLYSYSSAFEINDEGMRYSANEMFEDASRPKKIMDIMSKTALALNR